MEKETRSTVPGDEQCRQSKAFIFPQKDFKFLKLKLIPFDIYEFEIVYEDTYRESSLSDTQTQTHVLIKKTVTKFQT